MLLCSHLYQLGYVVRGDCFLKDYGFRLSQARFDSAEVSYAMALLPSFCYSAAFRFELVSMLGGTKMYFSSCVHLVRSKTKTTKAPTSLVLGYTLYQLLPWVFAWMITLFA